MICLKMLSTLEPLKTILLRNLCRNRTTHRSYYLVQQQYERETVCYALFDKHRKLYKTSQEGIDDIRTEQMITFRYLDVRSMFLHPAFS